MYVEDIYVSRNTQNSKLIKNRKTRFGCKFLYKTHKCHISHIMLLCRTYIYHSFLFISNISRNLRHHCGMMIKYLKRIAFVIRWEYISKIYTMMEQDHKPKKWMWTWIIVMCISSDRYQLSAQIRLQLL